MDEAQELADRVAIIRAGRIVAEGAPGELGGRDARSVIRFRMPPGVALDELPIPAAQREGVARAAFERPLEPLHALTSWALEHGHELGDLEVERPTLEDVYLELTESQEDGAQRATGEQPGATGS
jgi:ABC-2 type transport system ATP-binding protein